jgi:hypothetical protein
MATSAAFFKFYLMNWAILTMGTMRRSCIDCRPHRKVYAGQDDGGVHAPLLQTSASPAGTGILHD